MLVSFSVENFLSYKDKSTVIFYRNGMPVSHSILLGANASGKSNFGQALLRILLILSNNTGIENSSNVGFAFDKKLAAKDSVFQITFKVKSERFYQYTLAINYKLGIIKSEVLLFSYNPSDFDSANLVFKRTGKELKEGASNEIKNWDLRSILNTNISIEANKTFLGMLLEVYKNGRADLEYLANFIKNSEFATLRVLNKNDYNTSNERDRKIYNKFMQIADPTFQEIQIDDEKKEQQIFIHADKTMIPLRFEAFGTLRMLELSPYITKVLKNGGLLIVDEYEFALHPQLIEALVQLFDSKESNKKQAQILLIGHAGTLMGSQFIKNSDVWISQRKIGYESCIHNLDDYYSEYHKDRVITPKERQSEYLEGKLFSSPYPSSSLDVITSLLGDE